VGRDRDALESVSTELSGIKTIRADITTEEGRSKVAEGAAETSVLVNSAGMQFTRELSGLSTEEIDREVCTNLLAPIHLVHRFLPALLERSEAAIINLTSILAIVPKQSARVYCATIEQRVRIVGRSTLAKDEVPPNHPRVRAA